MPSRHHFITGMPRSGSTLLSAILQQNPRFRATVTSPVDVKVFFTPTCVYCPRMITLANQAAIECPFVTSTAIDATEYPDLVHRYSVNGVPKTVINDSIEIMGAASEEELITAIC